MTDLGEPVNLRSDTVALLRGVWSVRQHLHEVDAILSVLCGRVSRDTTDEDVALRHLPRDIHSGAIIRYPLLSTSEAALEQATGLFSVSSFTANRIREADVHPESITVVANGVAPLSSPPKSFEINHRVLLTVGAFKPPKGQQLAVRAFAKIADAVPGAHHHLVGAGVGKRLLSKCP